jgi:uncharacterized membrane protein
MNPNSPQPLWLKPLPFFIIVYVILLLLAGSFVITTGNSTLNAFGNTLMAFGAGIAIICVLATRSLPIRRGYKSTIDKSTPATKHIGLVFMAALLAILTGWLTSNFVS